MIRRDPATGLLVGRGLSPGEIVALDKRHERPDPAKLEWRPRARGLGDLVKRGLEALGIARGGCGGCPARQERLNELWPL